MTRNNKAKDLQTVHPQKYYLKLCFDVLYYSGVGYHWYEDRKPNDKNFKSFYKFWFIIINIFMFGEVLNEYAAYLRKDLSDEEREALYLHSLGHTCVMSKISIIYVKKHQIKELLLRFLEGHREFSSLELEKRSLKKARLGCIAIILSVYLTLVLASFSAVMAHIKEGKTIYIEVTFYPHKDTYFYLKIALRFLIEMHFYYIVTVMNAVDCICVFCLVFLSYKFIYLQQFFANLKNNIKRYDKSQKVLEEEFFKDFVIGIKLHEDALWCARNVQSTLGPAYSIQVIQCIVCVVNCLVKMLNSTDVAMFAAYFMYLTCIVILTAVYMVPGGDVTYEAAEVSTSIMHSGWEDLQRLRRVRPLAVLAMQRSQRPVVMNAFGIIDLSYTNLVSLLRSSYSFFAVMR